MKKRFVLSLLLLFVLSIVGCSSNIYSNEFLIDSEIIDQMSIGIVAREGEVVFGETIDAGEMYNVDVDNTEQVKALVDLLKDIKVEELSQEQIQDILGNPDVSVQKVNYEITLTASSETGYESLKGRVYLLEEGKLIFLDPKVIIGSIENAQEIDRTFVYISENKQADVINGLVEIIEEAKHKFLSNDKSAIQNTVKQFLEARWQLLQDYSIPLESFYDLSLPSAMVEVEKDKEIIKRHLIDPRNEAGIIVHSVKVDTIIDSVSIKDNSAEVKATVKLVEINEQIGEEKYTSKIANIEHDLSLVEKDDKWLIVTHKSHDMFTRIYD